MVHRKYTYKNGKRYGPYLYENRRVNGKVVTTYLGVDDGKSRKKNYNHFKKDLLIGILFIFFLVLLLLVFNFYGFIFTGRASLDIKSDYKKGEKLEGEIQFNLKSGELIPMDSKIIVFLDGESKESYLYDLIGNNKVSGNYFVEDLDITGQGEGYGLIGEKKIYPEVSFELKVFEIIEDDVIEESSGSGGEINVGNESRGGEQQSETSNVEVVETPSESPIGLEDNEEVIEPVPEENSESSEESVSSDFGVGGGSSDESNSGGENVITGSAISENEMIISGVVSKDKNFEYNLADGEDAEIVSGSVNVNGEKIDENNIKLDIKNNRVEVSSEYFIIEKGFGQEYIGNEKLSLEISLDKFNLSAIEGNLKVALVYNEIEIVSAGEKINVEDVGEINETITNETVSNITLINETSAINVSEINISVNTTQYRAILGRPVRWKKSVTSSTPVNLSIEIPIIAENVSIVKIVKVGEEILENIGENGKEGIDISENAGESNAVVDISGNVILGKISAEIDLNKEPRLLRWLKDLFKFTGFVLVEEGENIAIFEINESVKEVEIEYYTDAPYAVEEELENKKIVRIVGPEEVHYEDVLAFTELNESWDVKYKEIVKIYWKENDTYLLPLNIGDLDGNGIYDYVEWSVPYLSNQTFEIILIVKAEHLDENRTFIEDVYEFVKARDNNFVEIPVGHYVRVKFEKNLTFDKDITIYARSNYSNADVEVYEKDGTGLIAGFGGINEDKEYKVYLNNLTKSQDVFDLRVRGDVGGGVEFDYIVDPTLQTNNSGAVLNNITTENYPLSHITVNDSALVLYLPFDVNNTFWTNITYDYTTNNNDATALNRTPWQANGPFSGNYLIRNTGAGNLHLSIPQSSSVNITSGKVTVAAWINYGATTDWMIIVGKPWASNSHTDPYFVWALQLDNTNGNKFPRFGVAKSSSAGSFAAISGNVLARDRWYHLVGTYDGTTLAVYVNGALNASSTQSGTLQNRGTPVRIGLNGAYGEWYNGSIDEVMVFNRTLSANEITDLYRNQSFRYKTPASQLFTNVNISQTGTLNRVNVSTNSTILQSTNISLRVMGYNSSGGNIENTSYSNISDGNNKVSTFTITTAVTNITLDFLFLSNLNNSYSPILSDNIDVVSWAVVGDNEYPIFSNFKEVPANNTAYSANALYRFNSTVISTNGTVGLEFNGANYTTSNLTASVFNASVSNLAGGSYTYYFWAYGNGTSKNYNTTSIREYSVATAASEVNLTLNHTEGNITILSGMAIYLNGTRITGDSGATLRLYNNGTLINQGTSPISNLTNFTGSGARNITVLYVASQNYSQSSETYYVNFDTGDTTAPNATLVAPSDSSTVKNGTVSFNATGADNINVSNMTLYVWNSTNSAINQTTRATSGTGVSVNISVTLPYEDTFKWNYLASDNSSNTAFASANFTLTYSTLTSTSVNASQGTLNNITTEPYPLSHITLNDSALVFYMPFDVDKTSPTNTTYDYSPNNWDGTVVTANWNASGGYIGGAFEFKGTGQGTRIDLPNTALNITGDVTVMAWIKVNRSPPSWINPILRRGGVNTGYANEQYVLTSRTDGAMAFIISNCSAEVDTGGAGLIPKVNIWYHVVGMFNGTTVMTYVNGQINTTTAVPAGFGTKMCATADVNGVTIGQSQDGDIWNGTIDEVMVFNRTLSAAEITDIYNNQSYRFRTPASQLFTNINPTQDGTITRLNVTTNTTVLQGVNVSLRVMGYNSSGGNIENTSYSNISSGNNQVSTFTITTAVTNVTLDFLFLNNPNNSYSPVLSDSIVVTSWVGAAGANVAPTNPTPDINSSDGSNKTAQNLNCYDNVIDPDGGRLNVTVRWYNNTVQHLEENYNNSYANNSLFIAVLGNGNTTKGHNWSCQMRLHDGTAASSFGASVANISIVNTAPTITLSSPANGNITTNRTPIFSWSGSDDDSDTLQYEFNLTCYYSPSGRCSADDRYVDKDTIGSATTYTVSPYLKRLIDNNYYYNWTARVWDGEVFSSWVAAERNISIQSEISISLPVGSVNFGSMNNSQSINTSSDNPQALVLQNDGNAYLNISVNFTSLFSSDSSPTNNFQFMVRNMTAACFVSTGTQTTFTQAPTATTKIINQFNFTKGYQTGCNNVSIDLLITVPVDEPPGNKSSTITLTAALGEPGFGDD